MKPWKRAAAKTTMAAIRMHQWGHGDEAVEELAVAGWPFRVTRGFNGATAMKPWKRRRTGRRRGRPRRRFNGATAMKPWKSRAGPGGADT